jgi:hypothetical protein
MKVKDFIKKLYELDPEQIICMYNHSDKFLEVEVKKMKSNKDSFSNKFLSENPTLKDGDEIIVLH